MKWVKSVRKLLGEWIQVMLKSWLFHLVLLSFSHHWPQNPSCLSSFLFECLLNHKQYITVILSFSHPLAGTIASLPSCPFTPVFLEQDVVSFPDCWNYSKGDILFGSFHPAYIFLTGQVLGLKCDLTLLDNQSSVRQWCFPLELLDLNTLRGQWKMPCRACETKNKYHSQRGWLSSCPR